MTLQNKVAVLLFSTILISACNDKKVQSVTQKNNSDTIVALQTTKTDESLKGVYKANGCDISIEITETKDGYQYFLKTNARKVKGKATFSTNESGEKYLALEGIKWDEYEGDISNQEENDSVSDSKPEPELEIPVGIDASYVKDTLTIQNYGNSMNSYTKISECGEKYIQLIKKS